MRGITPVVAIILLLLITVSIVGFSFMFLSRTTQTSAQRGEQQLRNQTQTFVTSFSVESASGNLVYIRNRGTDPISFSSLAFYVDNQPVSTTGPASLDPGAVGIYALNSAELAAIPNPSRLKVSGGAFSDTRTNVCFSCGGPLQFDFSLSASPNSGSVLGGSSTTTAVTITMVSGNTTQPVTLSCPGLPAGITCTFVGGATCNPTCTRTLNISTTAAAPLGTTAITIQGTNGTLTRTTTYGLTVNAPGAPFDFSLSNSGNVVATQGSSGINAVTVTLVSGTTQLVTLSASGLPSGATATFNPSSGSPTYMSTLNISTLSTTPVGNYTITVTGTNGTLARTTAFTLTVNAAGDTTPPSVTINAPLNGATVNATLTINVTATDNVAVARVEFYIDGGLRLNDTTLPYRYTWNTTTESEGLHNIRARAVDTSGNSNQAVINVTVNNILTFFESGGQVVMEAENFDQRIRRNNHDWNFSTSLSGFSGTGYMVAVPDNGVNQNTGYAANSPEMIYRVNFSTAGTFYVWGRGSGPNGNGDSLHVGIDGVENNLSDRITLNITNTAFGWRKSTMDGVDAQITVSSRGIHNINIWMREDGARVDKMLLTTSATFTPTGTGPPQSPRG